MLKRLLGKGLLKATGWTLVGEVPKAEKYVLVCAHHTSNWDFVWFLSAAWAFDTKINWLGKHTLFENPFGGLLKATGGVPVNRDSPQNLVDQLADRFSDASELHLGIPPSGTRSYRDHWKSGFYRIAMKANVPVVLGILDFKTKQTGFGDEFYLTGDMKADMDRIRAFYADMGGKFPENEAVVRLRSEDGGEAT